MELKVFKWNQDADGIVTLTWDDPERSMNVLSNKALADIGAYLDSPDASPLAVVERQRIKKGFEGGAR